MAVHRRPPLLVLWLVWQLGWCHHVLSGEPRAFPGATGQGATAIGGRGGDVYQVTHLDDYNSRTGETKLPGSLRHAIRSATGPRTIVFDVSGLIRLKAPLEIHKSGLTIAGQTSPHGITLYGYPLELSQCKDVVIRYLRVRCGDLEVGEDPQTTLQASSANAINIGPECERIIVDHVSASWSIDETLSVTRCRDVTIQHCLIAHSLNDSLHPKGPHGYGSLVRGQLSSADQQSNRGGYTFFGNLWAHHRARNPSLGGEQRWDDQAGSGQRGRLDVNLVNNVIYNWGDAPTHRSQGGDIRVNLVNNYYINGPSKSSRYIFREGDDGVTQLSHAGNFADHDQDTDHDGIEITADLVPQAFREFDDRDQLLPGSSAFAFLKTVSQLQPAESAYQMVLKSVGASLWRDAIDTEIVDAVRTRTGALIDSPEELRRADGLLAGIDDLPTTARDVHFDTDGDGMPDQFERSQGLDATDPADRNGYTLSADGYTNLEVYLNSLPKSLEQQ